jgi:hypothetical protein
MTERRRRALPSDLFINPKLAKLLCWAHHTSKFNSPSYRPIQYDLNPTLSDMRTFHGKLYREENSGEQEQPNRSVYRHCAVAHVRDKSTVKTDLGLIYEEVKRDIHVPVSQVLGRSFGNISPTCVRQQ